MLPEHDAVLFSDYGKGGLAHIPKMIELARRLGKPVLVDPKGSDYQRYSGATAITPNRNELAQVIGAVERTKPSSSSARSACANRSACAGIVLTRSEEGMSLFDARPARPRVPAAAREVFDVTGAGDTVIATLATMLACGLDLRDGDADRQPRRRHRRRQVRHRHRESTTSCFPQENKHEDWRSRGMMMSSSPAPPA